VVAFRRIRNPLEAEEFPCCHCGEAFAAEIRSIFRQNDVANPVGFLLTQEPVRFLLGRNSSMRGQRTLLSVFAAAFYKKAAVCFKKTCKALLLCKEEARNFSFLAIVADQKQQNK